MGLGKEKCSPDNGDNEEKEGEKWRRDEKGVVSEGEENLELARLSESPPRPPANRDFRHKDLLSDFTPELKSKTADQTNT